jgi:alkylation response protein AidB-like acyl-CoA dehydrogenase
VTDHLTTAGERQEFGLSVRRFLADRSSEADVRRLADDPAGYDPEVWKQLAAELGLTGLLVPESHGGQGLSLVELVVALEETGRALLCAPLLAGAVLAPLAVLGARDDAAAARLLPGVVDGSALLAVALDDDPSLPCHASPAGGGWVLTGRKQLVLDGHLADRLLVVARAGDEVGLFEVDAGAAEVNRAATRTLDLAVRLSSVDLVAAPAVRLGGPYDEALLELRALAALAAAAHLVGIAAATLDIAVDYATTREQFGRPIGSYQGVKHLVAEMHARLESSRAAVAAAAQAAVSRPQELREHASIAKAWCSTAVVRNAEDCIQVLGGIGFTWEHPAHLYLRRAKVYEYLFGDARAHRAELARLLGLAGVGR